MKFIHFYKNCTDYEQLSLHFLPSSLSTNLSCFSIDAEWNRNENENRIYLSMNLCFPNFSVYFLRSIQFLFPAVLHNIFVYFIMYFGNISAPSLSTFNGESNFLFTFFTFSEFPYSPSFLFYSGASPLFSFVYFQFGSSDFLHFLQVFPFSPNLWNSCKEVLRNQKSIFRNFLIQYSTCSHFPIKIWKLM